MERGRKIWKWTFPYLLTTIYYLLGSVSSFAQITFERTYGDTADERGFSVQQTVPDGGYIITGWTESFGAGGRDVYLVKTDSLGDTLWTRTYGGTGTDEGWSVQQTVPDGGYIIAGFTSSFGAGLGDVYLIKTDSLGDTLWTRTYGGTLEDIGFSVQKTSEGGYILTGRTESFGSGGWDVYLIKTDSLGDTLWTRTFGGPNLEEGHAVQATSDGGYIIAGDTRSFGAGGWDFYIIKTDSLGETLWTRTYGDTNHEASTFVQETSDGGYIVAGYTSSFGAGNGDVYLIKTDSLGDTLWTRTFGGTANDEGWSVQQTVQDGGYIIAGGTTSFGAGGKDLYLLKTDSLAATLWARTYGGTEEDHGWSVQQTVPDGGYIIAGTTRSFGAGGSDVYLIKTDGNGQVGVKEEDSRVRIPSSRVMLYHNEPNPFHHITMIHYQIPDTNHESRITKHVTLAVYDITGKQVETLVDEFQEPGVYEVEWEGKNVSSGIYFYRLQTGDFIATRKMILLK